MLIKNIKTSKFLKDLFVTGLTQILVLLFGIILIKIMATALSKEYFGIFMVIKRIIAVAEVLITLNLTVGLARFISYEREMEREFLHISLLIVSSLSFLIIIIFFIFRFSLSKLFFNASNFNTFTVLTGFFLSSYGFFIISYAFFRGRQEMNRANVMNFLYYLFPVTLSFILWRTFINQNSKILSLYFFIYSLWGIFLAIFYIKRNIFFSFFLEIKEKAKFVKPILSYSVSRIPSLFFLSLTFGMPVFFATHKISLTAAGYVGISVTIVRLMEIFVTPFNLIFLPKFAEFKRINDPQEIKNSVSVVIDFIITTLPFLSILSYSMGKFIVIIFFGQNYIVASQAVSIVILFSFFYMSYVLTRGILDGLFVFPFVNLICLGGFLITTICSILFNKNIFILSIDLSIGLFFIGIISFYILIKKENIKIRTKKVFVSLFLVSLILLISISSDKWIGNLAINEYKKFAIMILYRFLLGIMLFLFYWKSNTLWIKAFLSRIKI